jgi:Protein of unknown function (DUF402)
VTDVVLREIRFGRVWRANACRLVEERDGRAVLWSPRGVPRMLPLDETGAEIRIPRAEWRLGARPTVEDSLALFTPGARHSLWLFWAEDRFSHWYVNFERHLGRSPVGWDYVDDKLDLVVDAAGRWRLKDEHELEQAHAAGLLDAAEVRAEAERILADPPWPTGWEDWRPEPGWPPPRLPDGWEAV